VALGTQAVALHAAGGDRSGGLVVERVAVADRARATRGEAAGGKAGCVAHRVAVADDQDRIRVVAGGGNGSGGVVRIVAVAGDADAVAVAARGGDGAGIDDGIAATGDLDRLRAQHAAVVFHARSEAGGAGREVAGVGDVVRVAFDGDGVRVRAGGGDGAGIGDVRGGGAHAIHDHEQSVRAGPGRGDGAVVQQAHVVGERAERAHAVRAVAGGGDVAVVGVRGGDAHDGDAGGEAARGRDRRAGGVRDRAVDQTLATDRVRIEAVGGNGAVVGDRGAVAAGGDAPGEAARGRDPAVVDDRVGAAVRLDGVGTGVGHRGAREHRDRVVACAGVDAVRVRAAVAVVADDDVVAGVDRRGRGRGLAVGQGLAGDPRCEHQEDGGGKLVGAHGDASGSVFAGVPLLVRKPRPGSASAALRSGNFRVFLRAARGRAVAAVAPRLRV